jgi:ABC-2 type transport system ATP-binding protein
MSSPAILVKNLTKQFKQTLAVDSLSFTAAPGTTVALLGGNGAGKSTTIAMLLGLLIPTAGEIEILGIDMRRQRHTALPYLNFSSPYVDLPHRLKVIENLRVYAGLYGIVKPQRRIEEIAGALDLTALLKRKTGSLSAGQKTRVALAKALLNEPRVLLLDEPTASLDPDTADRMRTYLEEYQRQTGATILLASHNMLEVERMSHYVLMLRRGKLVDQGTSDALIARHGRGTLEEAFLAIARAPEEEAA